ncbi:amidase [Streptomyces sp. NPDC059740]|uniref:amidase n=1 Tax=Streptomyces sp. NPDC059740 TaxID=3346926 RepID=UPI003662D4C7
MTELHELTALEQAEAVRRGETDPVEIVRHHLERAGRLGPRYGAFVTVTAERALRQAADARRRLATGTPASPLLGSVTAIKDLTPTADAPTSFGSRVFAHHLPAEDAHTVTLLRRAGTVSIGKTNTPEFGLCCYTDNDLVGPARNPWNPELTAGGSSGGAAVAVALGLVAFAHASDGGGSIRIPASACGLFGIKPSRGRVSGGPTAHDITGLAVQGPLARTVRDAAAALDVLARPMPGELPCVPPLPPGETYLASTARTPGRLRVARYARPAAGTEVAPECLAAWEHAGEVLLGLGHEVEDVPCPFGPEVTDLFTTVWGVKSLSHAVAPADEEKLRPVTRAWREHGRTITAEQFAAALAGMERAARQAVQATAAYDAVLVPTLATLPRPLHHFDESGDPLTNLHRQSAFSAFTSVSNMTGQPAVNLPLYWDESGLPVGVSLVGRPADEATLLALSAQLEAACPWRDRHPADW